MFHGSVKVSGMGVEPRDISGTGSGDRLGRQKPEETGRDVDIPLERASDVLFSAVDIREGVDVRVGGDELCRTSVDDSDVIFPRRRKLMGVGSMTNCCGWGNSVRSS